MQIPEYPLIGVVHDLSPFEASGGGGRKLPEGDPELLSASVQHRIESGPGQRRDMRLPGQFSDLVHTPLDCEAQPTALTPLGKGQHLTSEGPGQSPDSVGPVHEFLLTSIHTPGVEEHCSHSPVTREAVGSFSEIQIDGNMTRHTNQLLIVLN